MQVQDSEPDCWQARPLEPTLLRLDPPLYSAEDDVETSECVAEDVPPLVQDAAVESSVPLFVAKPAVRGLMTVTKKIKKKGKIRTRRERERKRQRDSEGERRTDKQTSTHWTLPKDVTRWF